MRMLSAWVLLALSCWVPWRHRGQGSIEPGGCPCHCSRERCLGTPCEPVTDGLRWSQRVRLSPVPSGMCLLSLCTQNGAPEAHLSMASPSSLSSDGKALSLVLLLILKLFPSIEPSPKFINPQNSPLYSLQCLHVLQKEVNVSVAAAAANVTLST